MSTENFLFSSSQNQTDPNDQYNPFGWSLEAKSGVAGGILGIAAALTTNYTTKKPLFAAIWQFPVLAGGFGAVCYYIGKLRVRQYQLRDAVVDHYIQLHPEDFKQFYQEPRKWSDVLVPWEPLRGMN